MRPCKALCSCVDFWGFSYIKYTCIQIRNIFFFRSQRAAVAISYRSRLHSPFWTLRPFSISMASTAHVRLSAWSPRFRTLKNNACCNVSCGAWAGCSFWTLYCHCTFLCKTKSFPTLTSILRNKASDRSWDLCPRHRTLFMSRMTKHIGVCRVPAHFQHINEREHAYQYKLPCSNFSSSTCVLVLMKQVVFILVVIACATHVCGYTFNSVRTISAQVLIYNIMFNQAEK